jgi:hypothetical protein
MAGLKNGQAAHMAESLAERYGCTVQRIYKLTEDLRPRRKRRADHGIRRAHLLSHPGLAYAARLVVCYGYDAEMAREQTLLNKDPATGLPYDFPVSLGTFRRYLRENGISTNDNIRNAEPVRSWSAKAPGEIFQIDISGVKTRWLDRRTRRILKLPNVSRNHPNTNSNFIPIWKIGLIDDYSRFRRVRFIAKAKPTSNDVIDFLLDAYREMGVPLKLYHDNDSVLTGRVMQRATRLLHEVFQENGGYVQETHEPYNAKASGKIENTHKVFEKFERLIGSLYEAPTLEALNTFCERVCERLNWREHRATGEKPAIRFRQTTALMRVPPPDLLDYAFKAKEFAGKPINANLTVSVEGALYQLPRKSPFVDLAGTSHRVTIVWPADVDWFGVITPDLSEYYVERRAWVEDAAGEYKQVRRSKRQRAVEALTAAEDASRKAHKEGGAAPRVPFFHSAPEVEGQIPVMPRGRDEADVEHLAEAAPGAVLPGHGGHRLTYFEAVTFFQSKGGDELLPKPLDRATQTWLKTLFSRRELIPETELREEIVLHNARSSETMAEMMRA